MTKRKLSVRIDKERKELGMLEHARMDGRMDEKISRYLMEGLTVEEAEEEEKDVLIVRVTRKTY